MIYAMTYQSVNPFNQQILKTYSELSDSELDNALNTAAQAFELWRQKSFSERALITEKVAALLRSQVDKYARLATLEMGKLIQEAREEVLLSSDIIAYYARNAKGFLSATRLRPRSGRAEVVSTPLGILLGIEPWNFPFYQLARFAAPNIMAGNVVMVKHAASVPQCGIAFEELWQEAGAPAGVYTNLLISYEQVKRLIQDPRVQGVALTGSVEAGKAIASLAGQNLKKSTMELGGSDPFIVLDDADLDQAVKYAVSGRMFNAGQCCTASKRFIVMEGLADSFLQKFKSELEKFKPGDPMDGSTTLSPLSSEAALKKLLDQVDRAIAHGAELVLGGKRIPRSGAFMEPTILTRIQPDNPAFHEEFFGPVALFFRVKDEQEAIRLANQSQFGLGGSVFTKDIKKGKRVAGQIETGMVFINQTTDSTPELPFGGIKNSGYGRELSDLGIHEFVNKKLVSVAEQAKPVEKKAAA